MTDFEKLEVKYLQMIDERCSAHRWELTPHVRDVMKSLLYTRDKIWTGGSFVQAVLDNNLGQAVRQADDEIVNHLKHMVIARDNFFVR
jgi:hypothetical protein